MLRFLLILTCFGLVYGDLFEAIDQEDIDKITMIINDDDKLLEKRRDGLTPILYSSAKGKLNIVKHLLELGADINAKDREMSGVLINGAASGNIELVKFLVESVGDINYQDSNGMSALHFAAQIKESDILEYLLKNGSKVLPNSRGNTPLFTAVYYGDLEKVKILLNHGGDIHEKSSRGLSLIYPAIISKDIPTIDFLVKKGVDITVKDRFGKNLINFAYMRSSIDVVNYLADSGVKVQEDKDEDFSIIHAAMRSNRLENVKHALEQDIVLSSKAKSALMSQFFTGNDEIFNLVYDRIMSKNLVCYSSCSDEETPAIFFPVFMNKPQYLQRFIDDGVSLGSVDRRTNRNILHEAVYHNKLDIVKLLVDKGIDSNNRDSFYGKSILHTAVLTGSSDMVNLIGSIDGCNINSVDQYGFSPYDYSVKYGFSSIESSLKDMGGVATDQYLSHTFPNMGSDQLKVVHTGHSGFVITDDKIALIFDYWEDRRSVDNRSLKNGSLNYNELKGKDIFVFASHTHRDHYDKRLFDIFGDKATYIFGFEDSSVKESYIAMSGRERREVKDLVVHTINSNDTGVGFVVEYNGQKIFHTGDHANRNRDLTGNYLPEIDYIKESIGDIDLLITPVSGCNFGDKIAVWKGNMEAISILNPTLVIPAHANSGNNDFLRFQKYAETIEPDLQVIPLVNPGDYTLLTKKGSDWW